MIIQSLKHDYFGNINIDIKYENISNDSIIHLMDKNGHINGYSLLRLNDEGLLKFRKIGSNNAREYTINKLDLDKEKKLQIIGVDLV